MRVLLSAYVCEPGGGSEHKDGWLWARELAGRCQLTLLTDVAFRDSIESAVEGWTKRPRRVYIDVSDHRPRLHPLLDVFPHYGAWQRRALAVAARLHDEAPFDVVHHVTYGSHRLPTLLGQLGIPLVWGPLGGGERVRATFASPRWLGPGQATREMVRGLWNRGCRIDPRLRATARQAAVIAVATPESLAPYPWKTRRKGLVMAKTAIDEAERAALAALPPRAHDPAGLSVAFTGRLLGWKGPTFALHAFARHARSFPRATLHLYGDGPLRPQLEREARRLGVADRVRLHGQVPRAALLAAYGAHHVFCFPSLHDSYPAAVLEAMTAGLPVVCLDAGGPARMVPDGAGVRVRPASPRQAIGELADALTTFTRDAQAWRRASEHARRHALDRHATPGIAEMATRLYAAAGTELAP